MWEFCFVVIFRDKSKMPGRGAAGKSHGKGKKGYYRYSGNKLPARFAASKPIHRRFPKSWKVVNR